MNPDVFVYSREGGGGINLSNECQRKKAKECVFYFFAI